jgi:hypothetical protein
MHDLVDNTRVALADFIRWLDDFGETSYDHQSFYASPLGQSAKTLYYRKPALGTAAVAPIIFCEAFLPSTRRLFWQRQRFPIADAHYASGFAFLAAHSDSDSHYRRAVHFLDVLLDTRCPGFERHGWGYPFDWTTRSGIVKAGTPLITSLPYVYEAFEQVYRLDHDSRWLDVMHSIAQHAVLDYPERPTSADASSSAYMPGAKDFCGTGVVNASAYRAFLLIRAACDLGEPEYRSIGERYLNFVLQAQNDDGSWYYAVDGVRDFVDHFHTCFVLKALAKIERLTGWSRCTAAIERGIDYYVHHLFDERGLPKPFSRAPRLTVYRRELYDCAECINLALLLKGRFPELDAILASVVREMLGPWRKRDGSFRSRQLVVAWDNVPMHRWAQAQMFRSLCFFLHCHQADSLRQPDSRTLSAAAAAATSEKASTHGHH